MARSARARVMDAALVFHEATNHVAGFARDPRLLSFTRDEPANVPLTFKEYRGLPTIQLELAPPSREASRAVDVLSRRGFEHRPFDAKALARVLAFSAGITRVIERGGRKRYMRAASTAFSSFPLRSRLSELKSDPRQRCRSSRPSRPRTRR